jgi:hypothetical protein
MSNFTLQMNHVINAFNEELYHMINVKVKIVNGKFPVGAIHPFINASDGTEKAYSFITQISGNQKEINGSFTTDAFAGLASNFTIEFGLGQEVLGSFENITTSAIAPLDPLFSDVTAPDATNAWLEDLLNNQE